MITLDKSDEQYLASKAQETLESKMVRASSLGWCVSHVNMMLTEIDETGNTVIGTGSDHYVALKRVLSLLNWNREVMTQ